MAGCAKTQMLRQLIEHSAQHRHISRSCRQCSAGPHAGMNGQSGDFLALAVRHNEQVERHTTMDARDCVGFNDQELARRLSACLIEPGKRTLVALIRQQLLGALAANAQHLCMAAIALAGDMAKLCKHAGIEPFEQRCIFCAMQLLRIMPHRILQFRPIGNRCTYVAQRQAELLFQRAPVAGIDPVCFDIDETFTLS